MAAGHWLHGREFRRGRARLLALTSGVVALTCAVGVMAGPRAAASDSKYALMWQWSGGGGSNNGHGDFHQIDASRTP